MDGRPLRSLCAETGAAGPLCFLEGGYVPRMMAASVVATLRGMGGDVPEFERSVSEPERADVEEALAQASLRSGRASSSLHQRARPPRRLLPRRCQVAGPFLRKKVIATFLRCTPGLEASMKTIDELLLQVVEAGASDLHLKVGSPPMIRVDGELTKLDEPCCSPEDTKDYAASLMSEKQIRRFSETNEIDFAYSAAPAGALPRERLPAAGHHLHRHAPGGHPGPRLRGAEPAAGRAEAGPGAAGHGAGHRDHRLGQDHHAGRHDRPHQPELPQAHRHDRGSHRDPPPRHKCIVNQREVGLDTENYGTALKYVLRQDPDIIFIGEMRDQETVRTALTAAQTGHFVLSTLHTIDVTETVNRIIDFFPLYQQKQVRIMLAGSLRGIISQRLLVRADGKGRVPGRGGHGHDRPHPRPDPRPGADPQHQDRRARRATSTACRRSTRACSICSRRGSITLADAQLWPPVPTTSGCWCSHAATRCPCRTSLTVPAGKDDLVAPRPCLAVGPQRFRDALSPSRRSR